jgi:hypothetical protein
VHGSCGAGRRSGPSSSRHGLPPAPCLCFRSLWQVCQCVVHSARERDAYGRHCVVMRPIYSRTPSVVGTVSKCHIYAASGLCPVAGQGSSPSAKIATEISAKLLHCNAGRSWSDNASPCVRDWRGSTLAVNRLRRPVWQVGRGNARSCPLEQTARDSGKGREFEGFSACQ